MPEDTGSLIDFLTRLRCALPLRWFTDDTPVLNAVLQGLAAAWVIIWNNLQFVITQTRVASATGPWLDIIANDFFGGSLPRSTNEADGDFRARILAQLFQPRATRSAMAAMLLRSTGQAPSLFEQVNIRDTGALNIITGGGGLFYSAGGAATSVQAAGQGGYGNINALFQIMVTATPPPGFSADSVRAQIAALLPCTGIAWFKTP